MKKIFCVVFSLLLCGCSAGKTSSEKPKTASAKAANILYSDELIDFEFIKLYDIFKIENMVYFDVRVADKSDKDICVCLTDTVIDGISVTADNGAHYIISAGKNALGTFSVNTLGTTVANWSDIKNLSFKITVLDTEMKIIKTTENVKIKLQNGKEVR